MKCVILASDKMGGIPIAECGGALLTSECRLVVKEELAARMLLQYGPRLIKVGDCERESLRGGHYQVEDSRALGVSEERPTKKEEPKEDKAEEKIEEKEQPEESPLEEISSDKAMHKAGKKKYKRK